ncbi:class I SAM-dependent methyltransferase [Neorhizobium galegae]|uniref:class I SAM-dependent methyltransferase n=1 Tax=Neorhizobium galegae TaxID=399 RepID=UPI0006221676|nr:methyltransferase domain-containing protein [Neorhizobium galegae]KAB1123033.1 methyltransferase domain-containing protein [Neorhizobium galegae]MCQ1569967.1 methyltransferase domain-containing protein [Neorhizobium galegae]MCQ1807505.1 methyltransferase domain-containing protein [Neorhizobium galegae]CDZ56986.1 Phospholipid N-methyltransferase [Neorhizobium galegae bv. orientalis]
MSDVLPFFRAWVAHPLRIASVVPSGRALGRLITSQVNPGFGPVLELGAGTGVFTQALVERGIPDSGLVLIEYTPQFARVLQRRYPGAVVICMDAAGLRHVTWRHDQLAGAVISGLPLLSMPPGKVLAILKGAFSRLRSGGGFYQFTYGPRCPVSDKVLDRLGLVSQSIGWVFSNFPPAQVYRLTRR